MSARLTMIRSLLAKDLRALWPLALLCMACFVIEAVMPSGGSAAGELASSIATFASALLIVAVVQLDAPAGRNLDWLTRPIAPSALLAEKIAFLVLTILLPSLAAGIARSMSDGLPFGGAFDATMRLNVVNVAAGLSLMAIAALTTTLIEAAALALAVALVGTGLTPLLMGLIPSPEAAPRLDAGADIIGLLCLLVGAGSALVLWLQYMRRHGRLSRVALAAALLAVVAAQVAFLTGLIF